MLMARRLLTKNFFKDLWTLIRGAANGFVQDRALKMSASLSYYTLFSLAPLLLLLISITGMVLGQDAVEGQLFREINGVIGSEAAAQIEQIITNMQLSGKTTLALVIGAVTLIIGATTVFADIQDSINYIWKVRAKPKRGWVKMIKDRLLSSSLIIGLGFLLIVSLTINGLVLAFNDWLKGYFPDITLIVFNLLNLLISLSVITVLFGIIFKLLPDVIIPWRDVRAGAFFTALLFLLGRYGIGIYIETTSAGSAYGAAGSIIVILLWVYYTAAILYFGAEFTRAYADFVDEKIRPADYAVHIEEREVEREVTELPSRNLCNIDPEKEDEDTEDCELKNENDGR